MNRREFLVGTGPLATAAAPADFAEGHQDFARAVHETCFNAAAQHTLGLHAVRGIGNRYEH
jgi:hypothetical protein